MGLLKNIAAKVVKTIAPVMDPLTVAFVHPIKTVEAIISPTKTVKQLEEEHFAQPLKKQITETVLSTVGYAGAIIGGAAIGGAAKAGTLAPVAANVAKSLIPSTAKGKIVAAVAAPVVIGAIVNQPVKTAQAVASAPGKLANVGGNIANLVANPSIENAKTLVTENPLIVGGAAAAAALAGAKTLLPAITASRQIEATQEQTAAIKEATAGITVVDKSGEFKSAPAPIAPQTQVVKEGVSKPSIRRKKRSSKAVMPSVKQNVSVIVQNKSSSTGIRQTKRYLNRELLIA